MIRELLMQVFELSPDAIVVVDDEGTIFLGNRQAWQLFGYEVTELIGRPVEMLIPDQARPEHVGLRTSFLRNPSTRAMGEGRVLFALRKDGSQFPVEISLSPVTKGGLTFTVAIARDTTGRVQHGLRTPLAEIVGLAEHLAANVETTKQRAQAEAILNAARRELEMVGALADKEGLPESSTPAEL